MSSSYGPYERTTRRSNIGGTRSGVTHWVPLALTVAAAVVGIAAWIWSERNDDDDDDDFGRPQDPSGRPEYGGYNRQPNYGGGDLRSGETAYGTVGQTDEPSYMARMSGALRRTPSPQQFFDGASRTIGAGVAAAGAAVGSALSSIREEDKNAYRDHQTWSEEAESRNPGAQSGPIIDRYSSGPLVQSQKGQLTRGNPRRKTVAIVVSADVNLNGLDSDEIYHHEHAVCDLRSLISPQLLILLSQFSLTSQQI